MNGWLLLIGVLLLAAPMLMALGRSGGNQWERSMPPQPTRLLDGGGDDQ